MKVKTITLTGSETKVEFDKTYSFVEINNLSKSEILISTKPEIARGNDDVIIVSAKTIVTIGEAGSLGIKEIYASGSGEIQIIGKNFAEHCFKLPASGDSSDEPTPEVLDFLPHPEGIYAYWDYAHGVSNTEWIDQLNNETLTCNSSDSFLVKDNTITIIGESNSYNLAGVNLNLSERQFFVFYFVIPLNNTQYLCTASGGGLTRIMAYSSSIDEQFLSFLISGSSRSFQYNTTKQYMIAAFIRTPNTGQMIVKDQTGDIYDISSYNVSDNFGLSYNKPITSLLLSTETNNIDYIQANLKALEEKYYPEEV